MPNFLEQLVAEWYEFRGYFVRRNIKVGPLPKGGFKSELDVVAFHPTEKHLVHIDPSTDAHAWDQREKHFTPKFVVGRKFIPSILCKCAYWLGYSCNTVTFRSPRKRRSEKLSLGFGGVTGLLSAPK
jgi:hypothetical protein